MTDQTPTSRPALEASVAVPAVSGMEQPTSLETTGPTNLQPDGIPGNFLLMSDGIYQLRPAEGGDLVPTRICSPILVKGMCRRPGGNGWARVVGVSDPDNIWHDLILDAPSISAKSTTALNVLFYQGLTLAAVDKAKLSVMELLASWQPEARYLRTDQPGWTDNSFSAFVLGNGRVLGAAKVITSFGTNGAAAAMHAKGSLKEWSSSVAMPCSGNPLMMLALSQAFSGPLLSMLGREGGGFHLRGASSCGKSTLLGVAASVWGAPSFVQSWRGTDNAFEGICASSAKSSPWRLRSGWLPGQRKGKDCQKSRARWSLSSKVAHNISVPGRRTGPAEQDRVNDDV